jgi:hypothetical protein
MARLELATSQPAATEPGRRVPGAPSAHFLAQISRPRVRPYGHARSERRADRPGAAGYFPSSTQRFASS